MYDHRPRFSICTVKGFPLLLIAVLVTIGIGIGAESAIGSGTNFPSLIYPSPVAGAPHEYLAQCPNPKGLESFSSAAIRQAVAVTKDFSTAGLNMKKSESDPSFWATLSTTKFGPGSNPGFSAFTAQAARALRGGPAYFLIKNSCGAQLIHETQAVVLIPLRSNGQEQSCEACRTGFYFIDRMGHPLLYFTF